ncbi:STAS domain-containing protein [Amycolatopsis sp. H20-H5]|uniref:STAS domain-containing protein n=1 Tax=Amycolatopsis sp. H20-H5 TaxID=3046309 RepID=UPI002DBA880C|nr:STAS domain-containing protein [Amycolatopsis sp. H20-H5]MEC3976707.1 STAS domain-containing protein [Amycolatopsis sp. H20-H5]
MLPMPLDPTGLPGLTVTTAEPVPGMFVLTAVGEIDAATVDRFRAELLDVCALGDRLVVDLSRVEFLSCAGLRALEDARSGAPGLCVVATHHIVLRALEMTGVGAWLSVRSSVGDACRDAVSI